MELEELIYQLNSLITDAGVAASDEHVDWARAQLKRAKDLLDKELNSD
ncbi:hypothetical protein ES705_10966 [subsurface metagenome]